MEPVLVWSFPSSLDKVLKKSGSGCGLGEPGLRLMHLSPTRAEESLWIKVRTPSVALHGTGRLSAFWVRAT